MIDHLDTLGEQLCPDLIRLRNMARMAEGGQREGGQRQGGQSGSGGRQAGQVLGSR